MRYVLRHLALSALTVACLNPASSFACAVSLTVRDRAQGPFDSVNLARIAQSGYISPTGPADRAWKATAIIEGRIAERIVTLYSDPSDCNERVAIPHAGEVWVIYIKRFEDHRSLAVLAMSLAQARREDPRFGGLPYPDYARRDREVRKVNRQLSLRRKLGSDARPSP
ncbi:hypothetical protein [Sphingobium sp.]|uniref:hypothetical protein n=1 Tax=Sphingobium sp. TaxID=1912891 RepID=UPI0035C71E98